MALHTSTNIWAVHDLTDTYYAYLEADGDMYISADLQLGGPAYLASSLTVGTTGTFTGYVSAAHFTDGANRMSWAAAAPSGTVAAAVGDVVFDTGATAGGTVGWVCTTAGTPGTWKTFGAVTA